MDWDEILGDSKTYSDEVKVSVNGTELTLGQLRGKTVLKGDFTKRTQELSEEVKNHKNALAQHQQALAQREALLGQTQQQLAAAMARRGVDPAQAKTDDLQAFRDDPGFAPLIRLIDQQKTQIDRQEQMVGQLVNRVQQDEVAINAWRYQQHMDRLKEKDTSLDPSKLAEFTRDFYSRGVDIEAAHRLMTYDQRMKAIADEAEKRGYEKAKAEPQAPPMPGGSRGRQAVNNAPALPKNMDERMAMMASDPAVIEGLEIGLQELQTGA